jgi:hypothetical protein
MAMPLDDRLRDALHSSASSVEPDVEHHLERVRGRSGRRGTAPVATLALAAVAVIAVIVGVREGVLDSVAALLAPARTSGPGASSGPAADSDVLVGTFRVTLDGRDPTIASNEMVGTWELTLRADSGVSISAPDTFGARLGRSLTGAVYALRDDRLYTNLFARQLGHDCAGSGAYRWELVDDRLILEVSDDLCLPRVALLTSNAWSRIPD